MEAIDSRKHVYALCSRIIHDGPGIREYRTWQAALRIKRMYDLVGPLCKLSVSRSEIERAACKLFLGGFESDPRYLKTVLNLINRGDVKGIPIDWKQLEAKVSAARYAFERNGAEYVSIGSFKF